MCKFDEVYKRTMPKKPKDDTNQDVHYPETRLRLRLQKPDGSPLSGFMVQLATINDAGDERQFASLMSGPDGYLATPIPGFRSGMSVRAILVDSPSQKHTVSKPDSNIVSTWTIDNAPDSPSLRTPTTSIIDADVFDVSMAPASFGLTPSLVHPRGLCGQLMPTQLSRKRFHGVRLVDFHPGPELRCGAKTFQTKIAKMLEFEITWVPVGYSLGGLIHSFSLAPCEQVKFGISTQSRISKGTKADDVSETQEGTSRSSHSAVVEETMLATSFKFGGGYGFAGKLSGNLKEAGIPLDLGVSSAQTLTGGMDRTTADATKSVAETITERATFVGTRHSTVVFEASDILTKTAQTRVVANHNKCHTLNVMFYAIDQNYRVITKYLGWREVALVKFPVREFDLRRAFCNRLALQDVLLDPLLGDAFDLLGEAICCLDSRPKQTMISSLDVIIDGSAHVTMVAFLQMKIFMEAGDVVATQCPFGDFSGTHRFQLNLPSPINIANIKAISFMIGGMAIVRSTKIRVECTHPTDGTPIVLATQDGEMDLREWRADVEYAEAESDDPCLKANCEVNQLLTHINCHQLHYNTAVWLSNSANDIAYQFEECKLGGPNWLQLVDPRPITTYADYVVFSKSELTQDGALPREERLVGLPTSGVHSEAILGDCNACELIDTTRYTSFTCETAPDLHWPTPTDVPWKDVLQAASFASNVLHYPALSPIAPTFALADLLVKLKAQADAGSKEAADILKALLEQLSPKKEEPKKDEPKKDDAPKGGGAGGGQGSGGGPKDTGNPKDDEPSE